MYACDVDLCDDGGEPVCQTLTSYDKAASQEKEEVSELTGVSNHISVAIYSSSVVQSTMSHS